MISDWELWACANLIIKQHGDQAELQAGIRADALLDKGDLEGQRVWLRILDRIRELRRLEPAEAERVH